MRKQFPLGSPEEMFGASPRANSEETLEALARDLEGEGAVIGKISAGESGESKKCEGGDCENDAEWRVAQNVYCPEHALEAMEKIDSFKRKNSKEESEKWTN